MRVFLFAMAAIFTLGGVVTIATPRASVVSHQGYRYKTGSTEFVSKDLSVLYGSISLVFGTVALLGAVSWKKWNPEKKA